ncbi:MAG TPA: phosphatase PAP2 family protein, partial [Candidatus Limnocylindrales bacterium]|nr:phosphatase PAP2 family protein [Candidatus Limnocylindrales bacterium]
KSVEIDSAVPVAEYSEAPDVSLRNSSRANASRKFLDDSDYILRAWAVILTLATIDWLWAKQAGIEISGMMRAVEGVATFAAFAFIVEYTGRVPQVAEAAHYVALWISVAVTVVVYSYVVATVRMPLRDADFARMDAALGFNWSAGFDWIMSLSSVTRYILEHAYNSMMAQVFASIAFFALIKRPDRNRELLWIGILSALITTTLSGLLPALGPYGKGGMPAWSAVLLTIRDGSLSKFALAHMTGIVAFPSFHTVMAVLLVYVHRPPLRSFVPVAILNVLMVVATPFAGHHYLVDLLSGAAVVAISIPIVHAAMRPRSLARLERA